VTCFSAASDLKFLLVNPLVSGNSLLDVPVLSFLGPGRCVTDYQSTDFFSIAYAELSLKFNVAV
jgi:hypothetical protein